MCKECKFIKPAVPNQLGFQWASIMHTVIDNADLHGGLNAGNESLIGYAIADARPNPRHEALHEGQGRRSEGAQRLQPHGGCCSDTTASVTKNIQQLTSN